ncbi:unnamed protein product, partial [Polarella glacialis]
MTTVEANGPDHVDAALAAANFVQSLTSPFSDQLSPSRSVQDVQMETSELRLDPQSEGFFQTPTPSDGLQGRFLQPQFHPPRHPGQELLGVEGEEAAEDEGTQHGWYPPEQFMDDEAEPREGPELKTIQGYREIDVNDCNAMNSTGYGLDEQDAWQYVEAEPHEAYCNRGHGACLERDFYGGYAGGFPGELEATVTGEQLGHLLANAQFGNYLQGTQQLVVEVDEASVAALYAVAGNQPYDFRYADYGQSGQAYADSWASQPVNSQPSWDGQHHQQQQWDYQ